MNLLKLDNLVKQYKSSNALVSLPFVIYDKEPKIRWFTYSLKQSENKIDVCIKSIFTAKDEVNIKELQPNLQLRFDTNDYGRPNINEKEYFGSLNDIFDDYDEANMRSLLENAEIEPLVTVYSVVHNYDRMYI